jgi:shikimate kinase
MNLHKTISLIGLMGAGKTTIGRKLAELYNVEFIDSDTLIEKKTGLNINEIFSQKGEPYFRQLEKEIIPEILAEQKASFILATGGGAFIDQETRNLLLNKTDVIWIKAKLETLLNRLKNDSADRPLLTTKNLEEKTAQLMQERHEIYAEAPIAINSDSDSLLEVSDNIITKLNAKYQS